MLRHERIQRHKKHSRFDRYLESRRFLDKKVFATLPLRYLERLNLVSDSDERAIAFLAALKTPLWNVDARSFDLENQPLPLNLFSEETSEDDPLVPTPPLSLATPKQSQVIKATRDVTIQSANPSILPTSDNGEASAMELPVVDDTPYRVSEQPQTAGLDHIEHVLEIVEEVPSETIRETPPVGKPPLVLQSRPALPPVTTNRFIPPAVPVEQTLHRIPVRIPAIDVQKTEPIEGRTPTKAASDPASNRSQIQLPATKSLSHEVIPSEPLPNRSIEIDNVPQLPPGRFIDATAVQASTQAAVPETYELIPSNVPDSLQSAATQEAALDVHHNDNPQRGRTHRRARIEEFAAEKQSEAKVELNLSESGEVKSTPRPAPTRPPSPLPSQRQEDAANQLFANREEVDSSAAAWAARLAKAFPTPGTQTAPDRHPAPPAGSPKRSGQLPSRDAQKVPVMMSAATRRFLKPLVGIDPASVPVFEGPAATEITSLHQADAITTGESIVIAPSHVGESPQQLGLLAHELTHVTQRRQPAFIPPIARIPRTRSTTSMPSRNMDEEALARDVEARVVRAAEEVPLPTMEKDSMGTADPASVKEVVAEPATASDFIDSPSSDETWGNLPAPWEPFPDWVLALPDSPVTSAGAPSHQSSTIGNSFPAFSAPAPAAPPIERAEHGRVLDEVSSASPAGTAELAKSVAPDMDLLAKQVYEMLKRRLEVERRRQLIG